MIQIIDENKGEIQSDMIQIIDENKGEIQSDIIQIIDENKGERQSDMIQIMPIDENPNIRDWRSMQNRKTRSTPVQETIKERRMEAL